jgi:hypothetical protein
MTQYKSAPVKLKARQIIISQMIDSARSEVIKNDIELHFLSRLKKKIEKCELSIEKAYSPAQLDESINDAKDNFTVSLEKLNYLKELRELSKADKIAASIEYSTPSMINIEY